MTMSGFQTLQREEQITVLYQHGVYIGKKKAGGLIRLLFQLDSFYVEITYADYRRSIYKIGYSDSTAILEPYLEQIDVEYSVT